MDDSMNGNEIANLMDWLKEHGCTDEEVIECIQYMVDRKRQKIGNKKSDAPLRDKNVSI